MRLADSSVLTAYNTPVRGEHDFYRCLGCYRVFTRAYEKYHFAYLSKHPECLPSMCQCGSLKYRPVRRPKWFEWAKPAVLAYVATVVLARGVAPWADRHCRWMLGPIERIVKPKEA